MGDKLCRLRTLLSATVALGISACTSGESPTGPGIAGDLPPAAPSFALAPQHLEREGSFTRGSSQGRCRDGAQLRRPIDRLCLRW
jgi:hypothetical protein